MVKWIHRIAALSVAFYVGWFWLADKDPADLFLRRFFLLFPLALIWFKDPLGEATGFNVFFDAGSGLARRLLVDSPSGPFFIALLGWVLLLSPIWFHFLTLPRYLVKLPVGNSPLFKPSWAP